MGETRPQPAGETHKPDSLPVSRETQYCQRNELCDFLIYFL